jgi:hypothetical protein
VTFQEEIADLERTLPLTTIHVLENLPTIGPAKRGWSIKPC